MAKIISYIKGSGLSGGIAINEYAGETNYIAVTVSNSKSYKTLKGAEKFMIKNGYEKN